MRRVAGVLVLLCAAMAAGCATTGERDPRDPFEGFNRGVYQFNEKFDEAVAKPVATLYRDALHPQIRDRIRNFFSNLGDVFTGVNNFLQGKPYEGFEDWMRVVFNSTLGVFGFNDVASDMGIEKHNEDFGQTFGRWGAGTGPYLVIPFFGSSDVRDGIGWVADIYTDPLQTVRPIAARNSLAGLRLVGIRADLLGASQILEEAALDKYVFQRDAYLQRRRSLVYDGRPPRPRYDEDEEEAPPAPAPGPRSDGATYLPRIPQNYDAVMTAQHANPR